MRAYHKTACECDRKYFQNYVHPKVFKRKKKLIEFVIAKMVCVTNVNSFY